MSNDDRVSPITKITKKKQRERERQREAVDTLKRIKHCCKSVKIRYLSRWRNEERAIPIFFFREVYFLYWLIAICD
jgi:hypothetical protein